VFAIQNTTEEWAHFIEMRLIDHYGRLNDGTGTLNNRTDGGEGSSGAARSEETKRKISEANKGNQHCKGKIHTEETKQKMSESLKGRFAWNKGVPMSGEQKRKLSEVKKGVPLGPKTEEIKQKIKQKLRGRGLSEKHKQKISNSMKGSKNSQFGRMWITNGAQSYRIYKIDPIPEGYRKGRVIKSST
jgi:hypothetical protein